MIRFSMWLQLYIRKSSGMDAEATGAAISVPVGENTLGRMFNVLGEPIDEIDAPKGVEYWPIHRKAPSFEEQKYKSAFFPPSLSIIIYPEFPLLIYYQIRHCQITNKIRRCTG